MNEEIENKLKLARCYRCGYEAPVKYKDRYKKVCPKCFEGESILEKMCLVPRHSIDHEAVAVIASDCRDWVDKDGRKQETL